MKKILRRAVLTALACASLAIGAPAALASTGADHGQAATNLLTFSVEGTILDLKPENRSVTIKHEAIPGYMDAMTMPFKVRSGAELAGLRAGDEITFRLSVAESESWIDQVRKVGTTQLPAAPKPTRTATARAHHPLLDYQFTNELGHAASLSDFHGQALAITFFFTRCPIPDYCPRLTKNFEQAEARLLALPNAPTNWHFLSITFDPAFDTPAVLKVYAEQHQYNPEHWSFWTGPQAKIAELAAQADVTFEPDRGFYNHNFRTLIIDAKGHLQMMFPVSGDLSEAIASEMLKAARAL